MFPHKQNDIPFGKKGFVRLYLYSCFLGVAFKFQLNPLDGIANISHLSICIFVYNSTGAFSNENILKFDEDDWSLARQHLWVNGCVCCAAAEQRMWLCVWLCACGVCCV